MIPYINPDRNYYRIPNDIFKLALDPYAFMIYSYLVSCAGKKRECWPSIPTMHKKLGISSSTIQDRLKLLEKRKFIIKEKSSGMDAYGNLRKQNNHYHIRSFDDPYFYQDEPQEELPLYLP